MVEGLSWSDEVFRVLCEGEVKQVAYVPDAGHQKLIQHFIDKNDIKHVPLTSEQEGVALLGGAWLGGERGALLMQSSGVGNVINMLSIPNECRFPLLMIVTMRGEWAEFNPWQIPMGQAVETTLKAMGVIVLRAREERLIGETVHSASKLAFEGGRMVAVLISQRALRKKNWNK